MGGGSSKEERGGRFSHSSSFGSDSSPWGQNHHNYLPHPTPHGHASGYPTYSSSPHYEPPPPPPPAQHYPTSNMNSQRRLDRKYSKIEDDYSSLEQVTDALSRAGLESSNLIVGFDFTKSNEWTGKRSFNNRSLHHIGEVPNPYEQAISIIGKTLSTFDEDNLIPCFGFGDALTHDKDVFGFYHDERSCHGFEEALLRYREIAAQVNLAGPTSFAPIIEMAMTIVEESGGQYHVLLIIADGQVTRSVDTAAGHLSPQEQDTIDAIVKASEYPLSIVVVGVGDGPWDMMREFDDNIPARAFDNFQFVNFTEIMSKNIPFSRKETAFALAALMEIPSQYKATQELRILGRQKGRSPQRVPLPPRLRADNSSFRPQKTSHYGTSPKHSSPLAGYDTYVATAPPASSSRGSQECPICLTNPKDMAFGCGHQTCSECGPSLTTCPICRSPIETRIKLF